MRTKPRPWTAPGEIRGVSREVRDLLQELQAEGWQARFTPGGHVQLRHRDVPQLIVMPRTPSDHRAVANTRSDIRKAVRAAHR